MPQWWNMCRPDQHFRLHPCLYDHDLDCTTVPNRLVSGWREGHFILTKYGLGLPIIQLLNDFKVYFEYYFARICNINRAAVGLEVDIANSSKILFNIYREIIQ